MQTNLGYEHFLPEVALHIAPKKDEDASEVKREIKVAVQTVFRSAVGQFMRDSNLYRVELPIDIYEGVKRYEIIPPEGFMINTVIRLREYKVNIPANCYGKREVMLTCCPTKDVDEAFYVEASLLPKRTGNCEFEEAFVEEYYDAILANMLWRLADMGARTWSLRSKAFDSKKTYREEVARAKRNHLNGGEVIKLGYKPMSSHSAPVPRIQKGSYR